MARPKNLHLLTGRPSRYEVESALEILARMEAGEPLHVICRDEHLPSDTTVWRWIADGQHPRFTEAFERARQVQGHRWFEETVAIADDLPEEPSTAQVFRGQLRVKARQWAAGRIVPEYSDRVQVDHLHRGRAEVVITLPQKGSMSEEQRQAYLAEHEARMRRYTIESEARGIEDQREGEDDDE